MENDWKTQLKKIEREFDGLPPEPTPSTVRALNDAERRARERALQKGARMGAAARMLLVFALGVALSMWPYERACGSGLFSYMAAEAMVVAGGLWIVVHSWRFRMPRAHALGLLLTLAGLVLVAAEVLPRIGYAQFDPENPPVWFCADA